MLKEECLHILRIITYFGSQIPGDSGDLSQVTFGRYTHIDYLNTANTDSIRQAKVIPTLETIDYLNPFQSGRQITAPTTWVNVSPLDLKMVLRACKIETININQGILRSSSWIFLPKILDYNSKLLDRESGACDQKWFIIIHTKILWTCQNKYIELWIKIRRKPHTYLVWYFITKRTSKLFDFCTSCVENWSGNCISIDENLTIFSLKHGWSCWNFH